MLLYMFPLLHSRLSLFLRLHKPPYHTQYRATTCYRHIKNFHCRDSESYAQYCIGRRPCPSLYISLSIYLSTHIQTLIYTSNIIYLQSSCLSLTPTSSKFHSSQRPCEANFIGLWVRHRMMRVIQALHDIAATPDEGVESRARRHMEDYRENREYSDTTALFATQIVTTRTFKICDT